MIDELNESDSNYLYLGLKNERNKLLSQKNMMYPSEVAETNLMKRIVEIERILKRMEQNQDLGLYEVKIAYEALIGLRDYQDLWVKNTQDAFEKQRLKSSIFQIDRLIKKIAMEYSF